MAVKAIRAVRPLATLVLVLLLFTCLATAWTYRLWRAYAARRFAVAVTRADQATTQQMQALATLPVGGDTCHRGAVVGSLLAAANGAGESWREGLQPACMMGRRPP